MASLRIFLFGTPRFEKDGAPLAIGRRKVIALLAYLARTAQPHTREALATLLWPDHDQSAALKNLRRDLARLKQYVGDDALLADRMQIGLDFQASVWVDVAQFEAHLQQARAHAHVPQQLCQLCFTAVSQAVDLHKGDFMAGFNLPDCPEFDEWQFFERESLRQALGESLQRLMAWHVVQATYERAIEYGRSWLALDPLHEPAHRQLMQLYAWAGQHAAALRQYQECVRLLDDELGVPPEDETAELHEAIRTRQVAVPPPMRAPSRAAVDEPPLRYANERLLAAGGHGEVFLGHDVLNDEAVVIKRLRPELMVADSEFVERFVREGQALRQLNHPNIVSMLDMLEQNGRPTIIMEYVSGGSLRDLIQNSAPMPLGRVLDIGLELADALSRAHHLNIIHRDMKPENVLLAADGTPRLTDFGVARLERDDVKLTQPGAILGSPAYMSPEALRGESLDARSDIWSFGVLLYEMLAGRRPFAGEQVTAVMIGILNDDVPSIRHWRPDVPDALMHLLENMLVKERNGRMGSVRQVAAVLEAIRDGKSVAEPGLTAAQPLAGSVQRAMQPRINVPTPPTPFIGRDRELKEIVGQLCRPDCSLLTLVGPGGIGKTRLALATAVAVHDQFLDGVNFVPLAPLTAPNHIITAIADSLDYSFHDSSPPEQQLIDYLRRKQLLLLLDNFEHLHHPDAVNLVANLLAQTEHVVILITSRERLNIQGEHLFTVSGLATPQSALASWSRYGALQLFQQSAQRVRADFALSSDTLPQAIRICQLVQGMPLGIELATAWLEMMSLDEIISEIEYSLDFLETEWPNLPERQRSVRAVFAGSWKLLQPTEQKVLAGLTVFKGGFMRAAAREVAAAAPQTLRLLVHKSWLQHGEDGRFQIHELLRQYGVEKLAETPDYQREVSDKHSRTYGKLLQSRQPDLNSARQQAALKQIEAESENLRVGWAWALAHLDEREGWTAVLDQYIDGLFHFYDTRSQFRDGQQLFQEAVQRLQSATAVATTAERDRVLGRLWGRQGWFAFHLGQHQQAVDLLQRSSQLLLDQGAEAAAVFSLNYLGAVQRHLGDYEAAERHLQASLAICRRLGDRFGSTVALNILGQVAYLRGDFDEARRLCAESLAIKREMGDRWGMTFSITYLGTIARAQGEYDEAQRFFAESMAISEEIGDQRGVAISLNNQGDVAALQQEYDVAQAAYAKSLQIFESIYNLLGVTATQTKLGDLARQMGEFAAAEAYLMGALQTAQGLQMTPELLDTIMGIAVLWQAQGRVDEALQLLALVAVHPAGRQESRDRANALLGEKRPLRLSPADLDKELQQWIATILSPA